MAEVDQVVKYSFYEDDDQTKPLVTKDAVVTKVHENGTTVDLSVILDESDNRKAVEGVNLNEAEAAEGNTYQLPVDVAPSGDAPAADAAPAGE